MTTGRPDTSRDFWSPPPPPPRRWPWGLAALLVVVVAVWGAAQLLGGRGPDWAGAPDPSRSPDAVTTSRADDLPPAGVGSRPERLLPPVVPEQPSTAWRPLMVQGDVGGSGGARTPVRWDPCRPITYVVQPKGAPKGGAKLVTEAFAELERATGLRFVDGGTTKEPLRTDRRAYQRERYGDRWAPVLVGWGDPRATGTNKGAGSGTSVNNTITLDGRPAVFVSGVVQIDAPMVKGYLTEPSSRPYARAVVLFHLARVAGLGTVDDPGQLLGGRFSEEVRTLREGDLAGLAALGNGPCAPWL